MRHRVLRGLAIGLFVSLMLNVFLAVVLVMQVWEPDDDHRHSRRGYTDNWRTMAEDLPEPHRAEAMAAWARQKEISDQGRTARNAARNAANEALASEPFDADALREAFAAWRAASSERWLAYQDAVLATAPHLSIEQRRAYVEASNKRQAEREARRKNRD